VIRGGGWSSDGKEPHRGPARQAARARSHRETLGGAGVDLRGLAAFTGEGNGIIQLLVEDDEAQRATKALHDARIGLADDREVLVVDIHDRPGTLGEMALELAAANVNIELAYSAFGGTRLVIATDDLENARAALA
jgi:hypothetical protein